MPESSRLPVGTQALSFGEAHRRHKIRNLLGEVFTLWGYVPVSTPLADFYEPFRRFVDASTVYRFVDREGDLLLLRPDSTLFLARSLALNLASVREPMRLWYAQEILRHTPANHPVSDTGFQAGAEFIGQEEGEADWEILVLACELLQQLGIDQYRIHLGCRRLWERLCQEEGLQPTEGLLRDVQRLSGPNWDRLSSRTREILAFIGTPEEAEGPVAQSLEWAEAHFLVQTYHTLSRAGLRGEVVLDLSELGHMPYYTGLVFCLYAPNFAAPVVSGGRYDELLGQFGVRAPSVGFSLNLGLLEAGQDEPSLPGPPPRAQGNTWLERLTEARTRRARGEAVLL